MKPIEQLSTAELLRRQSALSAPRTTEESIMLRGINAEISTRPSFEQLSDREVELEQELEEATGSIVSAENEAHDARMDANTAQDELDSAEDEIKKLKERIAELEAAK
jgi:peptidoglycan hydrolase CwlO-like protein